VSRRQARESHPCRPVHGLSATDGLPCRGRHVESPKTARHDYTVPIQGRLRLLASATAWRVSLTSSATWKSNMPRQTKSAPLAKANVRPSFGGWRRRPLQRGATAVVEARVSRPGRGEPDPGRLQHARPELHHRFLTNSGPVRAYCKTVETAREGGGDARCLCESAMAPFPQAALGGIMAWRRWDDLVVEQKTCLPTSRSVVES